VGGGLRPGRAERDEARCGRRSGTDRIGFGDERFKRIECRTSQLRLPSTKYVREEMPPGAESKSGSYTVQTGNRLHRSCILGGCSAAASRFLCWWRTLRWI
jgi:hypothetical protein